jgi:hypothetical protein
MSQIINKMQDLQNHLEAIDSIASIKRSTSDLDDLFGYKADDVEVKKELEVDSNGKIEALLEGFQIYVSSDFVKKDNIKLISTPNEINNFLKASLIFQDHRLYPLLGEYASRLIQNSYQVGCNDFYIDLTKHEIEFFGRKLIGESDRPLNLYVNGNLGVSFGISCEYVNVAVGGNCEPSPFNRAKNSTLAIDGDLSGSFIGSCSHNLNIFVSGKISGGPALTAMSLSIKYGLDAKRHPTYISMMQELDRRMKG